MKYIVLIAIRLYWISIPKSNRKLCIFKKTCSHFVYDKTNEFGLIEGLKAFWFRYNNCRTGFEIVKNPINNKMQLLLPSKILIDDEEIADRLLTN